jgi:hypothetical protein
VAGREQDPCLVASPIARQYGYQCVVRGAPIYVVIWLGTGKSLIQIIKRAVGSTVTMVALVVSCYTLSPFIAAAMLGSAVRTNNVAMMDALVDWQGVKASLRKSILARLDEKAASRPVSAGMLESVSYTLTDTLSPYMVDYVLGQRISPAGFALYMGPNSPQAQKVRAAGIDPDTLPSANTMKRIRRANFTDLTHFQIEIADRWDPEKIFLAEFELRGLFWQMSRVDMLAMGQGA